MSIEGIKISTAEVTTAAGSIRTINGILDARLVDIKKQMDDLASTWISDAATTIRANFNALVPRFLEYKQVIETYSKFLETTALSYENTETKINTNASAFK